jgi:hypothetical protein
MEVTLIVVTLVSIALAIAMGILTWRLLQEERLRSDARVAALEQGLAETMQDAYVTQSAASSTVTRAARAEAASSTVSSSPDTPRNDLFTRDDTDWLAHFPASPLRPATTNGAAERPIEPIERRAFAADEAERVARDEASDRPETIAARAGAGANGGAAGAALELMSLRQEMQDGTLTISGLVRNPRAGVPQERLTAVVFFFDGQGGFLSSTRAPLDYRALAPGEESPFQLSAPAPPGVARYRVSFRRDEGAVVPHVDRRQQVQGQRSPQEASRS